MKKVFKWIGIIIGSLIGLALVLAVVLFVIGETKLNKTYEFPSSDITVPTDEQSIAFGKHRAKTLCEGCHGSDLSGISAWFSAGPLGAIDSSNLTSGAGGIGQEYTSDQDYVNAIRHGIDPTGKPIFMPAVYSTSFLSDKDLGAIIAYVKSVPPVDHETYGHQFKPLAKIMLALGMLPPLPVEVVSHEIHVTSPERAVSVEYGGYLVDTNDCRVCHGQQMNGAQLPDPTVNLITPNLTPGGELGFWTEEKFIKTLWTGVAPSGHQLSEHMPWKLYRNMTDDELKAIFMYLHSLPKLAQYTE